jgi:hypothetical protein
MLGGAAEAYDQLVARGLCNPLQSGGGRNAAAVFDTQTAFLDDPAIPNRSAPAISTSGC